MKQKYGKKMFRSVKEKGGHSQFYKLASGRQ